MAERRLLVTLDIDANEVSCGRCPHLYQAVYFHCRLFTGRLEEGNKGPHRADACRDAERRHSGALDALKAVSGG